jgi:hypothetical protein
MVIDRLGTLRCKNWATRRALKRLLREQFRYIDWYLLRANRLDRKIVRVCARAPLSECYLLISKVRLGSILYITNGLLGSLGL